MTTVISTNSAVGLNITDANVANGPFFVAPNVVIQSDAGSSSDAIHVTATTGDAVINVAGMLIAGDDGVQVNGGDRVVLTSTGSIFSSYGLFAGGTVGGNVFIVDGLIDASADGILFGSSNSGNMATIGGHVIGDRGVADSSGAGNTVRIAAGGVLEGRSFAYDLSGSGAQSSLINHGTILGGSQGAVTISGISALAFTNTGVTEGAVTLGTAADSIVNSGTILGYVQLGGGADSFTALGSGVVSGEVSGGAGDDVFHGADLSDTFYGGDDNDTIYGGNGTNSLYGEAGNDALGGGQDADYLDGGDGSDSLFAGLGDDELRGGAGNDVLRGGGGADLIDGGIGFDQANYENSNAGINVDLRNGSAFGGHAAGDVLTGIESLVGSAFDDTLLGNAGVNILRGEGGNDYLRGFAGDDDLRGGDGNDQILGEVGFDKLTGGAGNDTMTGGVNGDTFIFADGFGKDVITDFEALNNFEKIDLAAVTAITDFADLAANHLTQVGADAVITDGANTITLTNVLVANLDANDFIF